MVLKSFKPLRKLLRRSKSSEDLKKKSKAPVRLNGTASCDSTASILQMIQVKQLEAGSDTVGGGFTSTPSNPEVALAIQYFEKVNDGHFAAIREMVTEDVEFLFHDPNGDVNHELTWKDFEAEFFKVGKSFPDFFFRHGLVEQSKTQDDVVVVHDLVPSGTHSGAPYAFGPCEPIQAAGKKVVSDPEEVHITCRDGKICKFAFHPKGEMSGFAGIYTLLGGFPLM
ncbi:expressed unknown protein [Seminavis robusta]|uniref:SnoaL-like domain-containing protein n=1 Tax=Seminavis robusta TaxID=568900 RepID=A0A9N8DED7_9STRA|nr:expressed unknown protein [Seminavis robusta]|eukprot:Sro116_g057150.1 n/a (225) ;mRNA; r:83509-84183